MKQRLEQLGESHPGYVHHLETWIMGTPEQAAEQLLGLAGAGVRRVMLSVESPLHQEMLPLLGQRVAPLVG